MEYVHYGNQIKKRCAKTHPNDSNKVSDIYCYSHRLVSSCYVFSDGIGNDDALIDAAAAAIISFVNFVVNLL